MLFKVILDSIEDGRAKSNLKYTLSFTLGNLMDKVKGTIL